MRDQHTPQQVFTLNVNGREVELDVRPDEALLWVLRQDLGLTGSKAACGEGVCGACSVLVDDRRITACTTTVAECAGRRITTLEGLASHDGAGAGFLHPVQQAFLDEQALQCGFCAAGQQVTAVALLAHDADPGDDAIREAMSAAHCRCGAQPRVMAAVRRAAAAMRSTRSDGGAR